MRAFLFALLAVGIIAFGSDYLLNEYGGFSSAEQATGGSVRLN